MLSIRFTIRQLRSVSMAQSRSYGVVTDPYAKESRKETILVTGTSGCVGQHLVNLLQQHERESVGEIRTFDLTPYVNQLEHSGDIPLQNFTGDLRKVKELEEAVKGVDIVIHAASLISVGALADTRSLREVNVNGTKNVVDACKKFGVEKLIYTSSIEVAIGHEQVFDGNEDEVPVPPPNGKFLLPGYAETKFLAERCVLENQGATLDNDKKLVTLALRLPMLYGELDKTTIATALKLAGESNGRLPRINFRSQICQSAYVRNAAWAHVCALRAMRTRPEVVGGEAFFVTDDTKLQPIFDLFETFLNACGYGYLKVKIPYRIALALVGTKEKMAKLIKPWYKMQVPESIHGLKFLNNIFFVNSKKAERLLDYKPLHDRKESLSFCLPYYESYARRVRPEKYAPKTNF